MFKPVEPKPNFPKLEEDILKFWEDNKIFEKSLEKNKDGEPFVFFEGPPTANAAPGIHHVEARSFKDIIPRYQAMRGKFVMRKAGWDTHGLPVELQIEKKLGISGKPQIESLKSTAAESIAYFNELCRQSVWQFKAEWERLTRRMGFWLDLEHPYVTYENSYIESVWWIIKQIWNKGLIYEGHKVVPYCPRCGTALSSHEVAQGYQTVKDNSVYVKFKLKDKPDTYILSWTTTPWTLPGNVALAVGESIKYQVVSITGKDERYIVASDLASKILNTEYVIRDTVPGKDLVGLEYEQLFDIPALKNDKSHRIYAAGFVTTTDGTGVVHTAVMYGEDDYELGAKIGLPKHHTVDEEGKFTAEVPGLAGLKVKDPETETAIFKYLESKSLLFKTEPYEHEYPHCWRCSTPLLYYARNSWFIKMSQVREQIQKNNETINWFPEHIKTGRFGEWLRELKDWAISRERYWGTPLPIWQCSDCKQHTVIGSIQELNDKVVSSKQVSSKSDLHRPYIDNIKLKCEKCQGEMDRVPAVLDVWLDSGAMPFAQYNYRGETDVPEADGVAQYPADYISEAIDQTRGWFYTLLAISTLLGKGASYKNVICLGHVLDAKGKKMSKSKGNVVDPFVLGDKYGFDILRWYFYSINQPGDTKLFAEKDIQLMQRKVQIILWNVHNYFVTYANAAGWKFDPKSKLASKNPLDKWLTARLQSLVNQVSENLDHYDIFHASREIEAFVDELSTWYVRRSRGRDDKEFFAHLYHALITLAKLMAPFMPFLTENIYQNIHALGFAKSVHLAGWPGVKSLSKEQETLLAQMESIRKIVEETHALRAKAGIKLRQPLARLVITSSVILSSSEGSRDSSAGTPQNDNSLLEILKDEVNVKAIEFGDKLEIDTNLTDDLKLEGLTRELERQIQSFRRESGLKIGEMAELYIVTASGRIKSAAQKIDLKKTYLRELKVESEKLKVDQETETEINGETIWFGIKKL